MAKAFGRQWGIAVFGVLVSGLLAAQQPARDFFDDSVIHDVRIDLDPNDWATLQAHYQDDTYYKANVSSGPFAASTVGIRSRGRGSRTADKPNLDVNIDKYVKKQTFATIAFFVLKANNQDASNMHEPVALKLFQKMGLPAPREAFARLYINGQYWGFYTIVEHEDEDFLDRNFGESKGDLWEWKPNKVYHFENLGSDPSLYSPILLDPKVNGDLPAVQNFVSLVQAINQSSDADFIAAISPYIDPKLYLTHCAIEAVLAEIDGMWGDTYGMNNFYLYKFAGQKLQQFIVWDKDLTFLDPEHNTIEDGYNSMLAKRLLAIPEYRQVFLDSLAKATDLFGGPGGWASQQVDSMYTLIRDAALNDPHKQCIRDDGTIVACNASTFETGTENMRSFIAARAAYVQTALKQLNYAPSGIGPAIQSVSMTGGDSGATTIAPGSLVTIRGTGLGADAVSSGSVLPRTTSTGFVAISGVRAPILSSSSTQVVAQVPWDLPAGPTPVAVDNGGVISNTFDTPAAAAAPGILAVVHADGSLVDRVRPAAQGESIAVFAVGLGITVGNAGYGVVAPTGTLYQTAEMPILTVGDSPAFVLYSGLAPGFVGLYQINAILPGDMSQSAQLQLSAGGQNTSADLPVQ